MSDSVVEKYFGAYNEAVVIFVSGNSVEVVQGKGLTVDLVVAVSEYVDEDGRDVVVDGPE